MQRIGIRREDKTVWEVRAPLVPDHVRRLVADHGVPIQVQSADRRIFPDADFAGAGAEVVADLAACDVIFGVKEIPVECFAAEKTYVFFSHTIKGQTYNLPMLRRMMELRCNLIDYERITDGDGRRLVFFGFHAGLAGMIDTLWALGQRFAADGHATPLVRILPAHRYAGLADAETQLRVVADACRNRGSLTGLGPIVCGIAGYGQVSQGAQRILGLFDPEVVEPEALTSLDSHAYDGRIVQVVFKEEHMVQQKQAGATFVLQDYYDHPERFDGVFDRFLAHLTVLVNCIYWEPKYPRLVTLDALNGLYGAYGRAPHPRLRVIGDISCDVRGSVECTVKTTDPGNPVYVYDVSRHEAVDGFAGNGPVIMAVDILPAELPREASQTFSDALVDLVPGLADARPAADFADWELPGPLKRAAILHRGKLTLDYAYLREHL